MTQTGPSASPDRPAPVLPVSVVIVSRGRPAALARCLTAVAQLVYPLFEIVVVADPGGVAAITPRWAGRIRIVPFDTANISAARNLGITHAAGAIVAFIDDDAVPEPTWLSHLVAVFDDAEVAAAGGFVRGRNGISWQWQARDVTPDGQSHPIAVDPEVPTVMTGTPLRAVKTEGTNMAFRRDILAQSGGFDPVFRFYLDETDLNLRLGRGGYSTAIVPLAQVHHGFAASAMRRDDRVPRDLHEIGASLAAFLRKHGHPDPARRLRQELAEQRRRLLAHMVDGRLEPRDVRRILATFRAGWAEGTTRPLAPLPPLGGPVAPFLPFAPDPPIRGHRVLSARAWQAANARRFAASLVAEGYIVSLHVFSISARYHRIRFHPAGFWLQTGGLFGRSDRSDPLFGFWRLNRRLDREVRKLQWIRNW